MAETRISEVSGTPRVSWSERLAFLTVILAVLGLSVGSPPLVGPDEGAHQATANYTAVHFWPPTAETEEYTPGAVIRFICTEGDSRQDASCWPSRDEQSVAQIRVLNYPPPYYWVVGLGQKFAPGADKWMDVGGRAASVFLNLSALIVLVALTRRRVTHWGSNLLAVTTPMVAFMWAVVNPNGWEISTGLLFGYLFARAWSSSDSVLGTFRSPWLARGAVAVSSVAFALSRHDAMVWMILLVLAIVAMGGSSGSRGGRAWLIGSTFIGLLAGLAWQLTHPAQHVDNNSNPVANPTLADQIHWLGQIDAFLPVRVQQMVGSLGALDTPIPQTLVLLVVVSWAALLGYLYARTRIAAWTFVIGAFGVFLVPSLMEVARWNDWPYWYQGRITLPFAVTLLFVILTKFGHRAGRAVTVLSIGMGALLAYAVWLNLMRYAFGISDYLPERWSDPAVGTPTYAFVLGIVGALVVVTVIRVWLLAQGSSESRRAREAIAGEGSGD